MVDTGGSMSWWILELYVMVDTRAICYGGY